MDRRALLSVVAGAGTAIGTAGCLDVPFGSRDRSESGSDSSPKSETTIRFEKAASTPDPEKRVLVENRGEDGVEHDVAVEVYHVDAAEVVHDRTHSIPAGERRIVYRTEAAEPTGIDAFETTCEFDGRTETVRIETSECYGPARFTITAEDELQGTYSIC